MKFLYTCMLSLLVFCASAQNVTSSLTACYALNGNGSEPINNLTATLSAVTPSVDRNGNPGQAYFFYGTTSSYITLPNSPLLKGTTGMSFGGWIRPSVLNDQFVIFTKNSGSFNFEAYCLTIHNNGSQSYFRSDKASSNGNITVADAVTPLVANTWYHVMVTVDNTSLKIYVNGVPEASVPVSFPFDYASGRQVVIGGSNESTFNLPFLGSMDNLRFYNRVITPAEVNILYTQDPSCVAPPSLTSGLTACYALNGNANDPINNLNGTLSAATPVADRLGNANSAYAFNGTASSFIQLPNSPLLKANMVSISAWVQGATYSPGGCIVFAHNGCGSFFEGYELAAGNITGTNRFQIVKASGCNAGNQVILYGNTALNAQTWYHVACYLGPDSLKIYVNGVLDASMANSNPLLYSSTAGVYLGGTNITGNTYPFTGSIDNVRFYNRKLTGTEINMLYTQDPSCTTNVPPVSLFPAPTATSVCEGSSITFTDASSNSPTSWNWQVTGPNTYSSTLANPTFTFQGGGTYMVSLTSSNGYGTGSTYTRTVSITATPTVNVFSTTAGSVCAGQSTTLVATGANVYSWSTGSGNPYIVVTPATNTVYSVVGLVNSCVGTATIGVNVNVAPVTSVSASSSFICSGSSATLIASGASTYLWNTQQTGSSIVVSPAAQTVYTVTGSNGICSTSATLSLFVLPSPTLSISAPQTTICQGTSISLSASGANSYSWSTQQTAGAISVSPTLATVYTVTGTTGGCSNTATVLINVNQSPVVTANMAQQQVCAGSAATLTAFGAVSYLWSTMQTGAVITVTPSGSTVYTVTGTSNGCSSNATVQVNVTPVPALTITASQPQICQGGNVLLTASGANIYEWNTQQTGASINVSPASTTVYTVTGAANTCSNTATVSIVVSQVLSLTVAASPSVICEGASAVLLATGVNTFSWSTQQSGNTITVTPSTSTVYTVTGISGGCSNTVTVMVNVTPLPNFTITAGQSQICEGQSISLGVSGAASSYTWSTQQIASTISASPTVSTTYSVTGSLNNCANTATFFVQVIPAPHITAAASKTAVCSGESVFLVASGAVNYSWNNLQTGPSINVNPLSSTVYTVTGTAANNCGSTATIAVVVNPLPVITATASSGVICAGQPVQLNATGAGFYTWAGLLQDSANITVTPYSATIYTVTGKDLNGCSASAIVFVDVQYCTSIALATKDQKFSVFPNPGNGIFNIQLAELQSGEITVTNVLSQTVYTNRFNNENHLIIDLGTQAKGIYYITLTVAGKTSSSTIVKQ